MDAITTPLSIAMTVHCAWPDCQRAACGDFVRLFHLGWRPVYRMAHLPWAIVFCAVHAPKEGQ